MDKGAIRASQYPYAGRDQKCTYRVNTNEWIWKVNACTKVDPNLVMLKSYISFQPVIVGFEVADSKFMAYAGGIYESPTNCGTNLNHYMLAVGWG